MYPSKEHQHQGDRQQEKARGKEPLNSWEMRTALKKAEQGAVKKAEEGAIYTQTTPRPDKKILLYDEHRNKRLFPLVRDRDVGISTQYQQIVIESFNDDDKQTSKSQMQGGMMQTFQDLTGELDKYRNGQV